MPELGEIGLDPAVQGVPVKKKLSVVLVYLLNVIYDVTVTIKIYLVTQNWTSLRR